MFYLAVALCAVTIAGGKPVTDTNQCVSAEPPLGYTEYADCMNDGVAAMPALQEALKKAHPEVADMHSYMACLHKRRPQ